MQLHFQMIELSLDIIVWIIQYDQTYGQFEVNWEVKTPRPGEFISTPGELEMTLNVQVAGNTYVLMYNHEKLPWPRVFSGSVSLTR